MPRTARPACAAAQSQGLLVFTAPPGSESHGRLALLAVLGRQQLAGAALVSEQ